MKETTSKSIPVVISSLTLPLQDQWKCLKVVRMTKATTYLLILNSISLTNRSLMLPFFLIASARILAGKNEEVVSFLSLLGMLKRIECPWNFKHRIIRKNSQHITGTGLVVRKEYIYFYGVKRYLKVCLLCEIFNKTPILKEKIVPKSTIFGLNFPVAP